MALCQQEELPSSVALSRAEEIGLSLSAQEIYLSLSPSNSQGEKALSKR